MHCSTADRVAAKIIKMAAFGPQTEFYPVLHNMVSDYVFHKIRQRQFNYLMQRSLCGKAICPPEFASLAIKFLGDEVTVECNRKFKQALSTAAADHIIAEHGELFSDEVYEKGFRVSLETIPSLVNEMGDMIFKEKQNMGTVAAFLAFGAMFSAYCEQKEGFGVQVVKAIVTSVAKHLDDNLGSWLKTNGGLVRNLSTLSRVCSFCLVPQMIPQ